MTIQALAKKYGSVFTLWLGNSPLVLINDLDLVKQGFNSKGNELNDRVNTILRDAITQGKGEDVAFSNHGPVWASLRRVAHSAVRYDLYSNKLIN
jgi:cytochrome P450